MIPFFITIDTEGDALWDDPSVDQIRTENVQFLPRFQELCEKYGFIPIWLTDYEIISDDRFVQYIKEKNDKGLCEVGIHVHARNNPPIVKLDNEKESGAAYLIEYPDKIMKTKFLTLKDMLEEKLECKIITHRAGRWALDNRYVNLLAESGIKYDCSITPGLDWSGCEGLTIGSKGSNYTDYKYGRQLLLGDYGEIVEYPVSVFPCDRIIFPHKMSVKNLIRSVYYFKKKIPIWLRANTNQNLNEMKHILNLIKKNGFQYGEFMIHSSEFMPGGGPKHQDKQETEQLFDTMDKLFAYAKSIGFVGHTFETWEKANKMKD